MTEIAWYNSLCCRVDESTLQGPWVYSHAFRWQLQEGDYCSEVQQKEYISIILGLVEEYDVHTLESCCKLTIQIKFKTSTNLPPMNTRELSLYFFLRKQKFILLLKQAFQGKVEHGAFRAALSRHRCIRSAVIQLACRKAFPLY